MKLHEDKWVVSLDLDNSLIGVLLGWLINYQLFWARLSDPNLLWAQAT